MHPCDRIMASSQFLQINGLHSEQLTRLHHFSVVGREMTFASINGHFQDQRPLNNDEQAFANRLCYVADNYSRHPTDLEELVERALTVWPHASADMAASNSHMRRSNGHEASVFAYP
jgi:hypothetical protein